MQPPSTPLVGTLHIKSKYLFGHTSRNVPIYLFYPYDTHYSPMRVGCSNREGVNKLALVRFESWDTGEKFPRGSLVSLFGTAGDQEAERMALLAHYAPLKKQIQKCAVDVLPPDARYQDWTSRGFTFNVDPPGCRDVDDVITLEKQEDGSYFFAITIANLSDLVPENSPQDILAKQQATTLYDEGVAVAPMLPVILSEEEASFIPGVKRRGLALSFRWTGDSLLKEGFTEVLIKVNTAFTYGSIYEHPIAEQLEAIASFISGEPTNSVHFTDSHKWIETFMVLYNKEVAKTFVAASSGLLRRLETVSPIRLEQKAATYCLPSSDATHAAFGDCLYTHATSPIRRYADLLAQRYLLSILSTRHLETVKQSDLDLLNLRSKEASRFERDIFFMKEITKCPSGTVPCIVLDWKEKESGHMKLYVEVPQWKRIISFPMDAKKEQESLLYRSRDQTEVFPIKKEMSLLLSYYCDMAQPNWKRRMVCTLKNCGTE